MREITRLRDDGGRYVDILRPRNEELANPLEIRRFRARKCLRKPSVGVLGFHLRCIAGRMAAIEDEDR